MKSEALPLTAAVIKNVRTLRKARGISAKELARLMGECGYLTSRTSVAQAECGYRKEISIDWIWAAAQSLRVPTTSIISPECTVCSDSPPTGYSCNTCGRGA